MITIKPLQSKLLTLALLFGFSIPAFADTAPTEPTAPTAPTEPAEPAPSNPPAKDKSKHPKVDKAKERIKEKCDSDPAKCEEKKAKLKERIEERKEKRQEKRAEKK